MKRIEISENRINTVFDICGESIALVHMSPVVFDENETAEFDSRLKFADITDSSDNRGRYITVDQVDEHGEHFVSTLHFFSGISVVKLSGDAGSDIFSHLPESRCFTAVLNEDDGCVIAFSEYSREAAAGELIRYHRLARRRCRDNSQLPLFYDGTDADKADLDRVISAAADIGCGIFILSPDCGEYAKKVRSAGMRTGTVIDRYTDIEHIIKEFRAAYLRFAYMPADISGILRAHPDMTVEIPKGNDISLLKTGALMNDAFVPEQSLQRVDLSAEDISSQLAGAMLLRPLFCGVPEVRNAAKAKAAVKAYKLIRNDISGSLPVRFLHEGKKTDSFCCCAARSDSNIYITVSGMTENQVIEIPELKEKKLAVNGVFSIPDHIISDMSFCSGKLTISSSEPNSMVLIRLNLKEDE